MDKREELSVAVKNVSFDGVWCKKYYYPNIDDKTLANLVKVYDPRINTNRVAAIIDRSLMFNCKIGTVFTITGVYDKDDFEKPYYFNYSDIEKYELLADKKGRTHELNGTLVITLKDGSEYRTQNAASSFAKALDYILPIVSKWDDVFNTKESGVIKKLGLSEKELKACHGIIHAASVAAGGVGTGLAQIPLSDNAIITPIQITMISSLALVFDIRLTEGAAKGILGSMVASFVGRGVSQVLVGWWPIIGNAINTATAAGLTEAVGWATVKHFVSLNESERAKYRVEGMKAGYEAASDEYEAKLRKQAESFIKQKEVVTDQFAEYDKLIKEYEEYIAKLEKTINDLKADGNMEVPQETIDNLADMKRQYDELSKVKKAS